MLDRWSWLPSGRRSHLFDVRASPLMLAQERSNNTGESREYHVHIAESRIEEPIHLIPLGDNQFRVASIPLDATTINYGDIISCSISDGDTLVFESVDQPSYWKRHDFTIPILHQRREWIADVLKSTEDAGGYWQRTFGIRIQIALPPNSQFEPFADEMP